MAVSMVTSGRPLLTWWAASPVGKCRKVVVTEPSCNKQQSISFGYILPKWKIYVNDMFFKQTIIFDLANTINKIILQTERNLFQCLYFQKLKIPKVTNLCKVFLLGTSEESCIVLSLKSWVWCALTNGPLSFTWPLCVTPVMIFGWLQDYYLYESYYYFPIPTLEQLCMSFVCPSTLKLLCVTHVLPINSRATLHDMSPTVRGHRLSTPRWCTEGVCARRHVHHILHVLDERVVCNKQ